MEQKHLQILNYNKKVKGKARKGRLDKAKGRGRRDIAWLLDLILCLISGLILVGLGFMGLKR
jgi:hypothetical protein